MNPLLAITAAKLGSNILGSIAGNSAEKAPSATEMKKAAFAQVLAKATNTPEYKNMQRLSAEGIGSRSDVEMTLQQISQKILQSPEIAKALEGGAESFDLKFLPDGNVALKKADGARYGARLRPICGVFGPGRGATSWSRASNEPRSSTMAYAIGNE